MADGRPFDLVVYLGGDWQHYHRRPMLETLAESMRGIGTILCVERPICPLTTPWRHPRKLSDALRGRRGFRRLSDNLFLYTPWVFLHDQLAHGVPPLRDANRWLLRSNLASAMTRAGMDERPRLAWIYNPAQVDFLGLMGECGYIYECLDDYAALNRGGRYSSQWIARTERDLAKGAALVFCTAQRLHDRLAPLNPETHYSPNAVRVSLFAGAGSNGGGDILELRDVPRPRIGFVGNVDPLFFDVELFEDVATRRSEWSFVIFGRVSSDHRTRRLLSLPNVEHKGFVPYERLAAILPGFDAGVIPFRKNQVTDCLSPLKLYEYMAAGCPVVSTSIPEIVPFAEWVGIADTPEAFAAELDRALARSSEHTRAEWRGLAKDHDWSVRVGGMIARISDVLGQATRGLPA